MLADSTPALCPSAYPFLYMSLNLLCMRFCSLFCAPGLKCFRACRQRTLLLFFLDALSSTAEACFFIPKNFSTSSKSISLSVTIVLSFRGLRFSAPFQSRDCKNTAWFQSIVLVVMVLGYLLTIEQSLNVSLLEEASA